MKSFSALPLFQVHEWAKTALKEDLRGAGDITTQALISPQASAEAFIISREAGIIAGQALAEAVFRLLDPQMHCVSLVADGEGVKAGEAFLQLSGKAQAILMGERSALNFLARLSGIATVTAQYVSCVASSAAKITSTRKTTPGLRNIEKYALSCGGGMPHRYGLMDAFLIKDNHILLAGGVLEALQKVKSYHPHMRKIAIEVDTLEQLDLVLSEGADSVLLDNMNLEELREAVRRINQRLVIEASGNINLSNVEAVARTGVDFISVGALTHSVKSLDLSLTIRN